MPMKHDNKKLFFASFHYFRSFPDNRLCLIMTILIKVTTKFSDAV